MHAAGTALVVSASAVTMTLAAPTPVAAWVLLRTPSADPVGPLPAAVALAAWLLLGWLVAVLALTAATRLPGFTGRLSTRLTRRIAPPAVRRAAALALGLTVATGGLAAPAAAVPAPPAPITATLDQAAVTPPALDWPTAAVVPLTPTPAPAPTRAAPPAAVVVRPGDTLWGLAADRLPPHAAPAAVAQAWPAWWRANRAVIGPDPDLLLPGTRLTPPTR